MKFLRQHRNVILFNIAMLSIILVASEILVRLFLPHNMTFKERDSYNMKYQPSGFCIRVPVAGKAVYALDRKGKIQYHKRKYRINEYGYRGGDFSLFKPKKEVRVVILGGSHVFDLESYDFRGNPGFPALIEKHFKERVDGYDLRVINAGTPGADTRTLFIKIVLDIHRYDPDIIIINSIWNDIKWISATGESTQQLRTLPAALKKNPLVERVTLLDHLLGFSATYRKLRDYYWKEQIFIRDGIHEGLMENPSVVARSFDSGLDQYRKNIIAAVNSIRSIGAVPVLAIEERLVSSKNSEKDKNRIQYRFVKIHSHDELVGLFETCEDIIDDVSRDLKTVLIDVNEEMEGVTTYFSDHVHMTPEGSRFVAEFYFGFLKDLIEDRILPKNDPTSKIMSERRSGE